MRKIDKLKNIQRANILAEQRYLEPKIDIPPISLDTAFDSWIDGNLRKLTLNDVVSIHNELVDYSHNQGYPSVFSFLKSSEDAYTQFAKEVIAPRVKRNKNIFNDIMVATYQKY